MVSGISFSGSDADRNCSNSSTRWSAGRRYDARRARHGPPPPWTRRRGVGAIGACRVEISVRPQLAIDLVGRHVQEAEPVARVRRQPGPIGKCRFQERRGADHVRGHEGAGPVDRAVDMGFRREVNDGTWLVLGEDRAHPGRVADIGLDKAMLGAVPHRCKIFKAAGIGQLVDGDDALSVLHQGAHQRRSDEARPACDDDRHDPLMPWGSCVSRIPTFASQARPRVTPG